MNVKSILHVLSMSEDCVVTISEIFDEPLYNGSIKGIPEHCLNREVFQVDCMETTAWHEITKLAITLDWSDRA